MLHECARCGPVSRSGRGTTFFRYDEPPHLALPTKNPVQTVSIDLIGFAC
jgi:hypothetical protein